MATSASMDTFTLPQYGGLVVEGVPNVTPMLSLISRNSGGLSLPGGGFFTTDGIKISWENAPARGVTNQDGAVEGAAPTVLNNINTQEYNVVQIWKEAIGLTFTANSTGTLQSGASATLINGTPIGAMPTRKDKQVAATIFAVQKAINRQLHRGTRTMPANNSSARIMGGAATLAGWTSDNAGAALTDSVFRAWLKDGWLTYGALRGAGPYVLFCDAVTLDALSTLYGTPSSRVLPSTTIANIGLPAIDTNYGRIALALDPDIHTYSCELIDLSEWGLYGKPTYGPNGENKGIFYLEQLGLTGDMYTWMLYGEMTSFFGHANHIGRLYNIGGTSA